MSSNEKKAAKGAPAEAEGAEASELSAEELESVAGGFNPQPDPPKVALSESSRVEYEKLVPAVNVLINTNVTKI